MCSSEPFITHITALKQWEVTKSWTSLLIPLEQTDQNGMCSWARKKRSSLGIKTCAVREQRHLKREFSQKWHCVLIFNDIPNQYDLLSSVEYQNIYFFVHAMKLYGVQIALDTINFHCMGEKKVTNVLNRSNSKRFGMTKVSKPWKIKCHFEWNIPLIT